MVKNLPANAGDAGDIDSVPGLGRSHGGGKGNLLQYFCLETSMDRGTWRSRVHGVKKELDMTERLSTAQHIIITNISDCHCFLPVRYLI